MAKGNNNPSGRRSTSRNAKPYDANNSFVKKVATKVTDLIPQRSWISKWFNSSQNEDDILDDTENREEIESEEDIQKPPPLKRPCIRMDVTHPPGTFTIQPRTKAPLNQASPSKQQYSVHNVTSEDFSEPAMAGPSGVNCLVSSTPATQPDIRNIVPQRPELHSLVTATNNGTTNGIDDNSESSESTSGCSSLIPQTIRQEATSNVPYSSPFSNRKRFNNEKLTFTNHTPSPRSLFLDSNRYTMSSRRPSFNASVMTNTPDRASPLSSPFYSGNITFGGANAAGLYKQGRNLFISSNEVQLKVPRRTSVEVKPSNATGVDSSGMSQTAKKILEALEHFSSPITDAKKIPLNTSMSAKRAREETSPTVKVGLRHLTRQLTVPTVPDILKLRRRQKLQDTTLAARKIVSARSEPPPPQEYHLRTQDDEDSKHQGKLKVKMTNLDEEETVQPVNLPSIPLPISSLPNFNFTPSGNSKSVDKNFATKEETFTFASPIKITNVTNSLKSINNFTFSSPISADNQTIEKSNNSSLPTKRSNAKSATSSSNCVPSVTQNFVWSGSSTAPRPKDKSKSTEKFIPTVSSELKSGSVMDIFNSKSTRIEPEKANNIKPQSEDKGKEDKSVSSKSGVLQDSSTMWECSECLVKNNNFETQCFACKAAKPCLKNNKTCELPSTSSNASETKTTAVNDHFGSQFKLSSNQWECPSCYLRNKHTDNRCPACNAQKPDSEPSAGKIPNSNKNNVKDSEKFEGSSDCVLNNSANSTEHTSCNVSKSSLLKSSAKNDENIADDSNSLNNQKTNTSINTPLNNLAVNKNEIMDKFKPSKDTWECPCCMVRNAASVDTCPCCNTAKPSIGVPTKVPAPLVANGFGDKFKKPEGAWNCDTCMLQNEAKVTECVCCGGLKPGTKKVDNSITNTSSNLQFSFGIPATTGDFKFGIDKTDQQKTDNASSFKVVGLNSAGSTNQDGQFTFGIQKEDKKSTSEISKPENTTSTVANCFGFQTDAKSSEKIDAKQDSEKKDKKPVSTFSFGIPKTESTVASDKPSVTIPPSTTLPSTFTFGVSKSETKETDKDKGKEKQDSLFGNTVTQVSKSSTEIIDSSTAIKANTLTTISQNISQEIKPTAVFTFGVPSTTAVISNSISTSIVTSLPSSTQSSFAFSDTKPVQTSIPTFGQIATSIPASTSSNTFTFGDNKTTDKGLPPKSFSALSNDSSGSSIFSNVSTTPSLFGNTDAKTIPSFGTEEKKQPTFGASASKPSAFAIPDNKIPTFGTTESKPSIFGTSDTKLPVFGNADNKTTPLFNTNPQAPAATPAPTFNASSPTPALFGTFATPPVFGSNTSTTFNNDSKPNIFGSNSKQGETNTPSSNLFTFNSTPAQPVAQPGTGFNFSANTNPDNSAQKPLFTFGSSTTSPQGSNVFGSTFNKPAANTSGLAFDTPKPKIPTFGQSAVSNPIFGVPQSTTQNQPSSSFIPNSNAGFNFGSAAPATSSGGFNFGAVASTPASSTGFNFNPPGTTPTFDPNTPPSFNFTGGNAPVMFSGTPQAVTQRKIKKAFRRVR